MKRQYVLSPEDVLILSKLNNEQLRLLTELKDSKFHVVLLELINIVIDVNKNDAFRLNEGVNTFAFQHAMLRGESAGQTRLLYLLQGAAAELKRRQQKATELKKK